MSNRDTMTLALLVTFFSLYIAQCNGHADDDTYGYVGIALFGAMLLEEIL